VSHFSYLKWHVKVTFQGTLQSARTATFARVTKRREDLKNLCLCIDFGRIPLLDDTVTELIVTRQHDVATAQGQKLRLKTAPDTESEYASIVDHLWLYIREDPFRVRFPVYNGDGGGTPTKDLSEIRKKQELSAGVHEVRVDDDEKSYVYKEVDRPLYEPRDSEVLEKELRNLELLRGTEGVVWLVAVVISKNPYRTAETINDDTPAVLRGILLEYHSYGTLRDALQSEPNPDWPWQRWAVQITRTLDNLHQVGITHMDLKPGNIVISAGFNAILIDVSGSGGVTQEWLSPEMRDLPDPLSENIESRKQNDIWALGKMLLEMADVSCNDMEEQLLRSVALEATSEVPPRISLQEIISKLRFE
jgi:serine/threonine protein kinase